MNSKKDIKLDVKTLTLFSSRIKKQLARYLVIFFLLFVVLVYTSVLFKINSLSNVAPSQSDISSGIQNVVVPNISLSTLQQIQNLQNHSVSVQALFNQARTNPFQ